jgi:hypothetical protein
MSTSFFTVIGVFPDKQRFAETVLASSSKEAEEAVLRIYDDLIIAGVVAGSAVLTDVEYANERS